MGVSRAAVWARLSASLLLLAVMADRVFGAALLEQQNSTELVPGVPGSPCWQMEAFMVQVECSPCNAIQTKWQNACRSTGYVEQVVCVNSKKTDFKSCHSAVREESVFWRFEAVMMSLTVLFVLVVVKRHRVLDRRASERVRKQLESS
ncbi:protein JTB-like isoform X2 [Engraulis encrasicolus]